MNEGMEEEKGVDGKTGCRRKTWSPKNITRPCITLFAKKKMKKKKMPQFVRVGVTIKALKR